MIDAMSEAIDIQNEVERRLLPFTVDCLAFTGLGSTYTTSSCIR